MSSNTLNNKRLQMIRKGYINKKELGQFLDVGKCKASKVFDQIVKEIENSGRYVDSLGIRVTYALDYLGFTEEDIRRFAQDELNIDGNLL